MAIAHTVLHLHRQAQTTWSFIHTSRPTKAASISLVPFPPSPLQGRCTARLAEVQVPDLVKSLAAQVGRPAVLPDAPCLVVHTLL